MQEITLVTKNFLGEFTTVTIESPEEVAAIMAEGHFADWWLEIDGMYHIGMDEFNTVKDETNEFEFVQDHFPRAELVNTFEIEIHNAPMMQRPIISSVLAKKGIESQWIGARFYVEIGTNITDAVAIINTLGYQTDEDEIEEV